VERRCATSATIWPFLIPIPVSTTSVALVPTTMPIVGKPLIAQAWAETRERLSGETMWLPVCA